MISLSTKDADFIAKIARKQLEEIADRKEHLVKQIEVADAMLALLKLNSKDKDIEELEKKGEKIKKEELDSIEKEKDSWEKVLVLMMEGSAE